MKALLALVLCLALGSGVAGLELVELSSENFEHETQATTGQTTGHWCVLFIDGSAAEEQSEGVEQAWQVLAADVEEMEHPAVFAKVDVSSSPDLAARFSVSTLPAAILFRDRMMFRLPSPLPEDEEAAEHLARDFLAGGWEAVDGDDVPPEAAARRGPAAAGGVDQGAAAAVAAAAALGRQLVEVLGETNAVLRATGILAAGVGVVIIGLASYLGINMNFTAVPREAAADAGRQQQQQQQDTKQQEKQQDQKQQEKQPQQQQQDEGQPQSNSGAQEANQAKEADKDD